MISRRHLMRVAASLPVASAFPALVSAQAAKTGKIVVGYPAGGSIDVTARHLADAWRHRGHSFIVDNRPGAAGRMANSQLKRERGDGSVILLTHTSALTIYPHVYTRALYDADADFTPVSTVAAAPCAFAISSAVPESVKTLADYVAWVRKSPLNTNYASPAAGSMSHFLCVRFTQAINVQMTHIGYRGAVPAMQDLLGGQIPAYMGFLADFLPHRGSNKIRVLAVTSERRLKLMPEVPTFAEQGFATVKGTETYGLFVPPGTPADTVQAIADNVKTACADDTLRAGFENIGVDPFACTPREYAQLIQRERAVWEPTVRTSGFKIQD